MTFTPEHMAAAFVFGYVTGAVSVMLLTRRGLTLESTVSLVIMALWIGMHSYGFFFEKDVPWLFDFAGFGATGNFIGVKLSDIRKSLPAFRK